MKNPPNPQPISLWIQLPKFRTHINSSIDLQKEEGPKDMLKQKVVFSIGLKNFQHNKHSTLREPKMRMEFSV
jgi:hypothetical protein